MYVRVRELLTAEERKRYMQIPSDISEWTLSDIEHIPNEVLEFVARQIRASTEDWRLYAQREVTR
nr:DUF4158 domain-containing protein [Bacillus toyonensis]